MLLLLATLLNFFPYLDVEERVEVWDDDVFVLHLAPHVLDGVNGRFIVRQRTAVEGELLQPEAAHLKQYIKHESGHRHSLDLCKIKQTKHG